MQTAWAVMSIAREKQMIMAMLKLEISGLNRDGRDAEEPALSGWRLQSLGVSYEKKSLTGSYPVYKSCVPSLVSFLYHQTLAATTA